MLANNSKLCVFSATKTHTLPFKQIRECKLPVSAFGTFCLGYSSDRVVSSPQGILMQLRERCLFPTHISLPLARTTVPQNMQIRCTSRAGRSGPARRTGGQPGFTFLQDKPLASHPPFNIVSYILISFYLYLPLYLCLKDGLKG